jgi:DNA polymerase-3 subunit delta'
MPRAKKEKAPLELFPETRGFFSNLIETGALSHAYLFFGDWGVGKRTFAGELARRVETGAWKGESALLDALFVLPGENGSISVDEARGVKSFLSQTPLASPRRTVVIAGAEALTPEAQGAMLKVVEEPPRSSLIIFVAETPDALFAPLRSRVQKIYFPRLPQASLAESLEAMNGAPSAEARLIAKKSFGSLGRALQLSKAKPKKPADLEERIDAEILELYAKGATKHSRALKALLELQSNLKRFNLNPRIQEKALAERRAV